MPTLLSGMPAWASASATVGGRREMLSAATAWLATSHITTKTSRMIKSVGQRINDFKSAFDQKFNLAFIDHVRRHEVDGVADRPQQQFARKCGTIKVAREIRIRRRNFKRPDHTRRAKI